MTEEPTPRRRGPAPGSGAKGGHRVTGRVTTRGLTALDTQAQTDGRDRSDVIGDLAEHLADQLGIADQPDQNGDQS